jgi:hypothetical protein
MLHRTSQLSVPVLRPRLPTVHVEDAPLHLPVHPTLPSIISPLAIRVKHRSRHAPPRVRNLTPNVLIHVRPSAILDLVHHAELSSPSHADVARPPANSLVTERIRSWTMATSSRQRSSVTDHALLCVLVAVTSVEGSAVPWRL